MTDKKTPKPEELTEAELDKAAGGILTTNENITESTKKVGGSIKSLSGIPSGSSR